MGLKEGQPPVLNNKGAGVLGGKGAWRGQAGYSGPFFPEQGKEKAPAWLWLWGNIELLPFNILWQA